MLFMKRFRPAVLAAALLVVGAVTAPPVSAESQTPATGTFAARTSPVAIRSAAGNTIIDFTLVEQFTGTMSGTRVGSGTLIIHPDGSVNVRATGVLTGSIAGVSGTVVLDANGCGTLSSIAINWVVSHGSGGLARYHGEGAGVGAATGPATLAGSYSGEITSSGS